MLKMMQDYQITSLCAPPTIFRFLIREDLTKYDLSSLKYCTIAGEALNPAVFDTFYKLTGIKLMEGFGQTETTLTIATFPWMTPKPGSMGMPNPQYDVDLLKPDGRALRMVNRDRSSFTQRMASPSDSSKNITVHQN
jgi:acetyl-CoA synthetase